MQDCGGVVSMHHDDSGGVRLPRKMDRRALVVHDAIVFPEQMDSDFLTLRTCVFPDQMHSDFLAHEALLCRCDVDWNYVNWNQVKVPLHGHYNAFLVLGLQTVSLPYTADIYFDNIHLFHVVCYMGVQPNLRMHLGMVHCSRMPDMSCQRCRLAHANANERARNHLCAYVGHWNECQRYVYALDHGIHRTTYRQVYVICFQVRAYGGGPYHDKDGWCHRNHVGRHTHHPSLNL